MGPGHTICPSGQLTGQCIIQLPAFSGIQTSGPIWFPFLGSVGPAQVCCPSPQLAGQKARPPSLMRKWNKCQHVSMGHFKHILGKLGTEGTLKQFFYSQFGKFLFQVKVMAPMP